MARGRSARVGQVFSIGIPYVWLVLFFALPFAIVIKLSFSSAAMAIPPYEPMFNFADEMLQAVLNLGNYLLLLDDPLYLEAYLGSIKMAGIATLGCLILGYPMAYAIAKVSPQRQALLLLLVMLPSWTSFLIRIYAWMGLLSHNGLINQALLSVGAIEQPLAILNTDVAVYIGMIYAYLPFMILPLYANLSRQDQSLLEAAADLGAHKFTSFWHVTLPLSFSGVMAGCMLVFIPAIGEFVIPELLGGPDSLMIGRVLWQEFFNNRDWPVASALAVVMLLLLALPIACFNHYQAKSMEAAR
ncbi:ABC transporter permease subunit [Shewanella sp. NIFS-20-20]|nr:ABC transporter permease subunit [Shewanella sp. NIFS-20-20]MBV7314519.1 ABC transporter permease subunit [Shewanella sp. NIFS-20-20]